MLFLFLYMVVQFYKY